VLEKSVLLEAISTPAAVNELLLQRGRVQMYRPSQKRIQIFKRYRFRMPKMKSV
jgi:hypothetical protein